MVLNLPAQNPEAQTLSIKLARYLKLGLWGRICTIYHKGCKILFALRKGALAEPAAAATVRLRVRLMVHMVRFVVRDVVWVACRDD